MDHNTVCYASYGLLSPGGHGFHYTNNVFFLGRNNGGVLLGEVGSTSDFTSDYNLWWTGEGLTTNYSPVVWNSQWTWTWDQYKSGTGQDAHSFSSQDPQFTNMPLYFAPLSEEKRRLNTNTKIYLLNNNDTGLFAAGDKVEFDFDGTLQTVTGTGSDANGAYLEVTPGDTKFRVLSGMVANWKSNTNNVLNVALKATSPGKNAASDSTDMGSAINMDNYMAGDFNGDGRRDIPSWPPQ